MFNGSFIPEAVSRIPSSELSDGAKIVYGRLMRYSGKDGVCKPKRKTLMEEVGYKHLSTLDRKIKELRDIKLIEVKQRGLQRSKEYFFLLNEDIFGRIDDTDSSIFKIPEPPAVTAPIVRESVEENNIYKYILPKTLGKTYLKRVWNFYALVWQSKYGFPPDAEWAKLGRIIKKMSEDYSEYQIAVLVLTHFDWHGASGEDEYIHKRLVEACFPFTWIPTSISAYKAHQRNVRGLKFDSEEDCKEGIDRYLKKEGVIS